MNTIKILVAFVILTSCDRGEVILTRSDLRLADSLFLVSRNEWTKKLEDSCSIKREQVLTSWTDSIMHVRLSEINLMLNQDGKYE